MREDDALFAKASWFLAGDLVFLVVKMWIARNKKKAEIFFVALGVFIVACLAYAMFIADTMKNCHDAENASKWCVWGLVTCFNKNQCKSRAEDKSQHLNVFGFIVLVLDGIISWSLYTDW